MLNTLRRRNKADCSAVCNLQILVRNFNTRKAVLSREVHIDKIQTEFRDVVLRALIAPRPPSPGNLLEMRFLAPTGDQPIQKLWRGARQCEL